jgi:hypothetical protein
VLPCPKHSSADAVCQVYFWGISKKTLAWLGGGAVVLAGGIWTAVVFFFPPSGGDGAAGQSADCGFNVVGDLSGSKIDLSNCKTAPPAKAP